MKDYKVLENKYKHLFHSKFFGIECTEGWYDLISEMLEEIKYKNILISCIKSKYADLRVYHSGLEVSNIIEKYEIRARGTCEFCGKCGETRDTKWIRVLCNSCYCKKYFKYKDVFKFDYYKYYICG